MLQLLAGSWDDVTNALFGEKFSVERSFEMKQLETKSSMHGITCRRPSRLAITLKRAPERCSGTDGNFREVNKCLLRVMFDSDVGFCLPKLVALDETRKQTSRFPTRRAFPPEF